MATEKYYSKPVDVVIVDDETGLLSVTQYLETDASTGNLKGIVIQARDQDGFFTPLEVTDDYNLKTAINEPIAAGTNLIGSVKAELQDNATNGITSTLVGSDQSLDVNVTKSTLPTGAATSAAQLPDGHNVVVDNADGASSVPIQGASTQSAAVSGNPVLVGGRDLLGQAEYLALNDLGGSIAPALTQLFDAGLVSINFASDGSVVCVGNTPHGTTDADAGEGPVKIGGHAIDYEPDTEDEQGRAEVTAGQRVDIAANRRGQLIEGVNSMFATLDSLADTYDNVTTTNTSQDQESWNYRVAQVFLEFTESGAAQDITIEVEASPNGVKFYKQMSGGIGQWVYDDATISAAGTLARSYPFPICSRFIRVKLTAAGTTAVNTITCVSAFIQMRN